MTKKPSFRPDFSPCGPNSGRQIFLKSLPSSVTIYHGHLSSWTIPEKTNDPIFRKLSDGRTDGQTDRQTNECDFIERCAANVQRQIKYFQNEAAAQRCSLKRCS